MKETGEANAAVRVGVPLENAFSFELPLDGKEVVTESDGQTRYSRLYWEDDALRSDGVIGWPEVRRKELTMPDYVNELQSVVERSIPALRSLSEAESARHPASGKWSPREVLGHLIDSASNNHQRFVRAQFQDDLVFPGYEQDTWVRVQRYQESPWAELVALWRAFNLHLARVMAAVPEPVRTRVHTRHNLDQIAWQTVAPGEPTTLDYLMADYVNHLRHHLRQILGPG